MGCKRFQLATGVFLSTLQSSHAILSSALVVLLTFHCIPITAAVSALESQLDVSSDIDHDVDEDAHSNENGGYSFDPDLDINDSENDHLLHSTSREEHESPLPASLARATLVGAQLRSREHDNENTDEEGSLVPEKSNKAIPNLNTEGEISRNPKSVLTGCVWGSAGCNKGKWNTAAGSGPSINSSSVSKSEEDDIDTSTASLFAGSATAKIKAHVEEARGGSSSSRRASSKSNGVNTNSVSEEDSTTESRKPPQGFQLSARVVTSPSDGLSYYLDLPEDPNALEIQNWMMNIPYTFVECGPTVESTTEAFMLEDMVVRHFPHGAAMGHWVNLAGGITIDGENENDGGSYINENHDGHPNLLIPLSPIEITVSGNSEETRTFHPGEVVLMEDTLGKGHKMRAARVVNESESKDKHAVRGQDLKVLMVSLPHTVHYSLSDWEGYSRNKPTPSTPESSTNSIHANFPSESPSSFSGAKHSIFGLTPKHHSGRKFHNYNDYRAASLSSDGTKPCPLEYDSAYSSLFTAPHHQRRSRRRKTRKYQKKESAFSSEYPPPPGHSTYDDQSVLFRFLPSLRRTMLFGIGLSLTSSFVYCVQLLYPPLLALIGGATLVMGGVLINVLGTRWSYRQWLAVWEEEWRWRREIKRHREAKQERKTTKLDETNVDDDISDDSKELHDSQEALNEDTTAFAGE
ncbi:hypothetical protein HJC23_001060 [Cyclotella cryptica]|uniref:Transmembrane protein n=1 Tax=Cyclotella cryptica TaxID=29204 RepID=A0ABD3QIB5_9STRA|eukprot:CCRYP_005018-RA/>CCRYP_005018-RA protein AED:0.00 eAED:0.00 QI:140/-1/1/1/-1/1/1/1804/689